MKFLLNTKPIVLSEMEYLKERAKAKLEYLIGANLKKKAGDDKLIITLVLIALGVGLCIVYRNSIYTIMTTALTTLGTQIHDLLSGTVTNS